jgi:phosphoglycolate phosphatase-like HAD superfamily hydrolase
LAVGLDGSVLMEPSTNARDDVNAPRPRSVGARFAGSVVASAIWIPITTITLLTAPLFLTRRTYGSDWTLHLWLMRQQQFNIESLGHPSLLMSTRDLGVFYPVFAFTGSGIYTVGAYLSMALGDRPIIAYKLMYVAGFCLAFGGMTWLSTQCGLRGRRSQAAGMTLVTGAYFVTDFVGRGDFGEFLALCSIPFVIAAGRAIVTSATMSRRYVIALVVGVFVFTGSHNITLMLGSGFFLALAVVTAITQGVSRPVWKRWWVVVGASAVGVGLNAWYLFPDLAWGSTTQASTDNVHRLPATELVQFGMLLNPFRPASTFSPYVRDVRLAVPWMFLAWVYVVARERWSSRERRPRRLLASLAGLVVVYMVFIAWQAPWRLVPHVLYNIQMTWRLHGYVLLLTALLVLLALQWEAAAPRSARRAMGAGLAALLVVSLGAAVWQVWRVRSEYVANYREIATGSRFADDVVASRDHAPASWYPPPMYRDFTLPVVSTSPDRELDLPVAAARREHFAGVVAVPEGTAPFRTNVASDAHFVRLTGITIVGRTPYGMLVATRASGAAASGPIAVTIDTIRSTIVVSGAVVSLVSLLALVALLVWLCWPRRTPGARRQADRSRTT